MSNPERDGAQQVGGDAHDSASEAFGAVNRCHKNGEISSEERQLLLDAVESEYREESVEWYSRQQLIDFLDDRDEELKRHQQDIAENHEPEEEREREIGKVKKRREEVRYIKRLLSHSVLTDYPDLPEGYDG